MPALRLYAPERAGLCDSIWLFWYWDRQGCPSKSTFCTTDKNKSHRKQLEVVQMQVRRHHKLQLQQKCPHQSQGKISTSKTLVRISEKHPTLISLSHGRAVEPLPRPRCAILAQGPVRAFVRLPRRLERQTEGQAGAGGGPLSRLPGEQQGTGRAGGAGSRRRPRCDPPRPGRARGGGRGSPPRCSSSRGRWPRGTS